jgi:antitoxin PrlF
MTVATITSKGQVTVPKGVRSVLGVKAGDRIDFIVNIDGSVSVKPIATELNDVQGMLKTDKKVSIDEMDNAIAAFHKNRS